MKITKHHETAIAFIATAIFALLLIIAHNQEKANQEKLAQLHAGELSACWQEVKEHGGSCRIEYIKDRTDTIIGAKVIMEAE